MDVLKKVPVREQDPQVRLKILRKYDYGYNKEEAMEEAMRCIGCKMPSVLMAVRLLLIFRNLSGILKKEILRLPTRNFPDIHHFPAFADVYALRKTSVKANASGALKANRYRLENWNVL